MKKFSLAAATVALAVCGSANASDYIYGGGVLSRAELKFDQGPTPTPKVLGVVLGHSINPNFAWEFRLGTGIAGSTKNVFGTNEKFEVARYAGVYARGILPLNDNVSVYGLIGYTNGKFKASVGPDSISGSDNSSSYGIGADLAINKTLSFGLEWASLVRADQDEFNALSLIIKQRF